MSENQRKWYDKVKHASRTLELIQQNIREDDVQAIAEALKVNTSLKALDLRVNQIGDAGAQAIAEALKVNTTLTHLYLDECHIGVVGAQAIAEALKVNTVLTEIYLRDNQIGDAGAQAIAETLKVNTILTALALGKNHISVAGAQAIAEALKVNRLVNHVRLNDNQIGDAGALAIAEVLKVNKKLRYLSLSNNFITIVGINALWQTGNTICKLDFSGQRVPSPAMLAARAAANDQPQPSVNPASEIQQLRSELASKQQELTTKNQELASKAQELAAKDDELAALDQELAANDQQLRSKLAAKNNELHQLRSNLAHKKQELANKTQELATKSRDKRRELQKLRSDLAAKEQSLAIKDQALAARDQELATKDLELKSALDRIDALESAQHAVEPFSNFDKPIPQVPLATLVAATNNFAADSLLGKGAFGCVYGANLPGPSVAVAIKKLSAESKQGAAEFKAELASLSKFRHANIIAILSYAEEGDERCLVYEFMPNGSVRDRLDRKSNTPPLTWSQRHGIAADVARGMHYVQTAFPDHALFHLDLKTDNVLLDAYFNAKVSDFGLVRAAQHLDDKSYLRTQNVQGTVAYMCPDFLDEGRMTIKTDVYAFGMILLELLTAVKPGNRLKTDSRKALKSQKFLDMLDSAALKPTEAERQSVSELVVLALECLEDAADDRPSFGQLIATLDP
ncbi:TKL/IRAK protein kinase [Capsaspora owczarzaki ATCC 30864]|uniref:TKL/IRAK protein kinase n=2 Tax=Capsaspora owczarzaki (strain ATCC 30864) TaxID=595528 RepID=A0A0D2UPF2_CAPO3|nr:TKL/IRAK protein kinase [Capsaspora owczarzaki ATCC 30864]